MSSEVPDQQAEAIAEDSPNQRFLDVLYVDPSVASCSVLASKIYDNGEQKLLGKPTTVISGEAVVVEPAGWRRCTPSNLKRIGKIASGDQDFLLGRTRIDRDTEQTTLYANYRGDVLMELAYFAIIGNGPCNYVQFVGEVDENQVSTPLEERQRKPILKDVLSLFEGHTITPESLENFHSQSSKDMGTEIAQRYDLSPYQASLLEYIFCSDEEMEEVAAKIESNWNAGTKFRRGDMITLAYAEVLGRKVEGTEQMIERCVEASSSTIYSAAVALLSKDIFSRTVAEFGGYRGHHKDLRQAIRDCLGSLIPNLDEFTNNRFQEVFGFDYDRLREEVMTKVFARDFDSITTLKMPGAYSTNDDVVADVMYGLNIVQDKEDANKRNLTLTAAITTMTDAKPTLCGQFIADKVGNIMIIGGDGARDLSTEELEQLSTILKKGTTVKDGPDEKQGVTKRLFRKLLRQAEIAVVRHASYT